MKDFNAKSREAYNKKAHDYDNTPEGRFTRKFKDMRMGVVEKIKLYFVLFFT